MTLEEFRAALEQLKLTQLAAGRLLGYDMRTVRRWANGERGVPVAVGILLRLLVSGRLAKFEVDRARRK
jgi:transcriptional regulator with XRE-family HTH domain